MSVIPAKGPTLGELVQHGADAALVTPASAAGVLGRLLGQAEGDTLGASGDAALLRTHPLPKDAAAAPRQVQLTERGEQLLARWRVAGLVGHTAPTRERIERVQRGEVNYRTVLGEIASHVGERIAGISELADLGARDVDAALKLLDGMCREPVLGQGDGTEAPDEGFPAHGVEPPTLTALPRWLDPNERFAAGHPLGQLRQRMEGELAAATPSWQSLPVAEQARRRLQWLEQNRKEIVLSEGALELAAALDQQTGRWSALRYWLTGGTPP